jgi:hypothetical protein
MRRHLRPRTLATILFTVLLLAGGAAAQAYIVYLKDGSHLVSRGKYKVVGARAIITLQNGTETFVPATQIDVAKTEEANRDNYGDAVVLRDDTRALPPTQAPPARRKTLADLIEKGDAAPREREAVRREAVRELPAGKTSAGFVDFAGRSRQPYPHLEVATELQQVFHGQGVEEVQIFEGTRADRPFVEITTASEASVFRALTASADALTQLRAHHPKRVAALELLLTTPTRERAGQFVLTPEMAAELTTRRVEAFFVQNVQF